MPLKGRHNYTVLSPPQRIYDAEALQGECGGESINTRQQFLPPSPDSDWLEIGILGTFGNDATAGCLSGATYASGGRGTKMFSIGPHISKDSLRREPVLNHPTDFLPEVRFDPGIFRITVQVL